MREYGISKVFLFGSYAKGTANENSDIDLLIEKGKPMSLLKLFGLRQECEGTLNLSVDLVATTGVKQEIPAFYCILNKETAYHAILCYTTLCSFPLYLYVTKDKNTMERYIGKSKL